MKKYILVIFVNLFMLSVAFAGDSLIKKEFVGIWSMIPLKDGTANVVQYTDDEAILYKFTCDWGTKNIYFKGVEVNSYKIKNGRVYLTRKGYENILSESDLTTDLKIDEVTKTEMKLAYDGKIKIVLTYAKLKYIYPLCGSYWGTELQLEQ